MRLQRQPESVISLKKKSGLSCAHLSCATAKRTSGLSVRVVSMLPSPHGVHEEHFVGERDGVVHETLLQQRSDTQRSPDCYVYVHGFLRRRPDEPEAAHKNASPVPRLLYSWQHLQHKCPEKHSSSSTQRKHAL